LELERFKNTPLIWIILGSGFWVQWAGFDIYTCQPQSFRD